MMTTATIEVTNKATGMSLIKVASTIGKAKAIAIRIAGNAGWLNFVKLRGGDMHAENSGFIIDIMV